MRRIRLLSRMAGRAFALAIIAGVICGTAVASAQATVAEANSDPVLKAMSEELDRNKQRLQLVLPAQNFPRPFFIEYRLEELYAYEASASYGAALGERDEHRRVVRVTVRLGDYKADSSTPRGDGSVQIAALDDDTVALRSALWSASDGAYKAALRDFTAKQAALKSFQSAPQQDDFSRQQAVVVLNPTQKLDLDRKEWRKRIEAASGLYRTDQQVKAAAADTHYSNANILGRVVNRYLVNTEGSILRTSKSLYQAGYSAGTQAADGMRLDRSYSSGGLTASRLDSSEEFQHHVVALLLSLQALKNAPLIEEEYHGPVLFSNDAASDIVREVFAPGITAERPDPGTEARTKGSYASSYKARVLPEMFRVTDDPGLKTISGKDLLGSYAIDDEGVPEQAVTVVESGKLTNYLTGRMPIKDFPESNGHGRAQTAGAARAHIGVLRMEATGSVSDAELNKRLLALAKERGLQQVYMVQTLGPELTPRLLYRINVADGKKQLVRGATIDELDQRSLRSGISAAGNEPFVANYFGDIPETVLAPALLFDDVTLKRANERNDKLPYYPPPS